MVLTDIRGRLRRLINWSCNAVRCLMTCVNVCRSVVMLSCLCSSRSVVTPQVSPLLLTRVRNYKCRRVNDSGDFLLLVLVTTVGKASCLVLVSIRVIVSSRGPVNSLPKVSLIFKCR